MDNDRTITGVHQQAPQAPETQETQRRSWRRTLLALTAACVATLVPLTVAGPADAAEDPGLVTWGVRPADTDQGANRPNYAYALDPGTVLADALIVSNYTDRPLVFAVYAADGFVTEEGVLDLLPAGEESQALGTWVTFEQDQVTLAGGESVVVPFELSVPTDATPGDYAAGVVSSLVVENTDGVTVDRRLGSRMHVRVTGDLTPALTVDNLTVAYEGGANPLVPGTATVTFTVTNAGNTRLEADAAVMLTGPWGTGRRAVQAPDLPELLPGTSSTQSVAVADVWPLLRLTATVTVDGQVISAVVSDDVASVSAASAKATASVWAAPWGGGALLVLLVALLLWRRTSSRRRRHLSARAIDDAVAQALRERDETEPARSGDEAAAPRVPSRS